MYCIYQIRNLVNNKTYIGQHKTTNLNDNYMGSGLEITKAIKKYGKENFEKTILAVTETKENINILEKVFIQLFREIGKAEYNISDGGEGGNLFEGHKHKSKYKEMMRDVNLGENNPFYGRKHSEETKEKLRNKRLGVKLSEETLLKISKSLKGHPGYFKNHKHNLESKNKIVNSCKLKINLVREKYFEYKKNHPEITWNEFQNKYKGGKI